MIRRTHLIRSSRAPQRKATKNQGPNHPYMGVGASRRRSKWKTSSRASMVHEYTLRDIFVCNGRKSVAFIYASG